MYWQSSKNLSIRQFNYSVYYRSIYTLNARIFASSSILPEHTGISNIMILFPRYYDKWKTLEYIPRFIILRHNNLEYTNYQMHLNYYN